jgi:hypothetical protein
VNKDKKATKGIQASTSSFLPFVPALSPSFVTIAFRQSRSCCTRSELLSRSITSPAVSHFSLPPFTLSTRREGTRKEKGEKRDH